MSDQIWIRIDANNLSADSELIGIDNIFFSQDGGIVKSRVLASSLSGGVLQDSIVEDSSLQDERDLLVAGESSPFPGGGLGELEHHGKAGSAGSAPLGLAMAQSDRGESRLDRIGRPQVLPMLGGEGVERQEFAAIFA